MEGFGLSERRSLLRYLLCQGDSIFGAILSMIPHVPDLDGPKRQGDQSSVVFSGTPL